MLAVIPPARVGCNERKSQIFHLPIEILVDAGQWQEETKTWQGMSMALPFLRYDDEYIWGAAAYVLWTQPFAGSPEGNDSMKNENSIHSEHRWRYGTRLWPLSRKRRQAVPQPPWPGVNSSPSDLPEFLVWQRKELVVDL